jgi:transcriptional regulator with XRE-family HTH domain
MQKEVAGQLGVHVESVKNWERGASSPTIHQVPKIIEFLGYDPEPEPAALPERIAYARCRLGLTQESLAKAIGVNPVTVYRWEKGNSEPAAEKLDLILDMLRAKSSTTRR